MDAIMSLLQDFDIASLLPEPEAFFNDLEGFMRLILLAAPLVVLVLGLWYYFAPPKRGKNSPGFRTSCAMGSESAWHFTQKLAGICYIVVGGGLSVIMLIVSLFFRGSAAMAMATATVICVIIEFAVILVARFGIQSLVSRAYDKDGNRRK